VQALFRPPNPPSPLQSPPPTLLEADASDETAAALAEATGAATEDVAMQSESHGSSISSDTVRRNEGNGNSNSTVISLVSPEERNPNVNASGGGRSAAGHSNRGHGGAGVNNARVGGRHSSVHDSVHNSSRNAWASWDINDLVKLPVSVLFSMRPELQRGGPSRHHRLHHSSNSSSNNIGGHLSTPSHLPVTPHDRSAVLAMRMANDMAVQRGGYGTDGFGGESSDRSRQRLDIPVRYLRILMEDILRCLVLFVIVLTSIAFIFIPPSMMKSTHKYQISSFPNVFHWRSASFLLLLLLLFLQPVDLPVVGPAARCRPRAQWPVTLFHGVSGHWYKKNSNNGSRFCALHFFSLLSCKVKNLRYLLPSTESHLFLLFISFTVV